MRTAETDILKRALERERRARKAAETLLESKSAELYELTQELQHTNAKLESLLKARTSELKGLFENIVDAYVVMDLEGNVLKLNDPAELLLGHSLEEAPLNLNSLVHPEEVEKVSAYFAYLMTEGTITDAEIRIKTADAAVKLVHINASLVYNELNQPIGAQGIVRDVTEARRAQRRLVESEGRLSNLIANLESAVLLEDQRRHIVLTNQQFCDFFQIPAPPEMLIGQNCENAAEQSKHLFAEPEAFVRRIDEILRERQTVIGDELQLADGKILERDYVPIFIDNEYQGHLWSYRDVTLQHKYRQSLDAERQKYSSIIANMNLGLIEVDNDDVVQMVNQRFVEMSGYSEEELLGKKASELLLETSHRPLMLAKNQQREKGNADSFEIPVRTAKGEQRFWLISGASNYNINGEVVGSIGIHLDITELKELELQKESLLKKLEKSNQELEEYAHVVSHDLKSPLRHLYALVHWLREDNADKLDADSLKNVEMIQQTLENMEQMISDVLDYSSVASGKVESVELDLNELVQEVMGNLHIPDHFQVRIKGPLPLLQGDRVRFSQLFQNLISNAIKYNDKPEGYVEIAVAEEPGHYRFSVADNGMGIEEKYHEKIFEVFQALSASRESTGVGLSIVRKVVDLYGGKVWLESQPGKGTTFYFTIKKS